MTSAKVLQPITVESLEQFIFLIRGQKIMLDEDLAALYGVSTKRLNEQVRRNHERFPEDFMFVLTSDEAKFLRSHFATSNEHHGGRRYLPHAFTQEGVAMLSSVLRSSQAIQVNIEIMRAFVRIRSILAAHKELARKVERLERKTANSFEEVFKLIKKYIKPTHVPSSQIGFRTPK